MFSSFEVWFSLLAHEANHFGKELKILQKVGRTGFRRRVVNHVFVERFPLSDKGVTPCRVGVQRVHAATAIVLCHDQPDR